MYTGQISWRLTDISALYMFLENISYGYWKQNSDTIFSGYKNVPALVGHLRKEV